MTPLGRAVIVDAVVAALVAYGTLAGTDVYAAKDWPTTAPNLPNILVKAPAERKESLVRGLPQFTTTATITVLGRVSGETPQIVDALMTTLARQVELAIISAGSGVQQLVQQFASVDTETRTTSDAALSFGDVLLSIACEFYEDFPADPATGVPLAQIGIEITQPAGDAPTLLSGANTANPGTPIIFQP